MKKLCALIIVFAMLVSSMGAFATGATITEPLGGVTPEGIRWRYNDGSRSEIWILGFENRNKAPETLVIPSEITRWSIILQKYVTAPVTKIANTAFEDCMGIKRVELPNSIVTIGYAAFSGCKNLEEVVLSDNLKNIESNTTRLAYLDGVPFYPQGAVFCDCDKLTYVKIPGSLKNISEEMFGFCDNLETVEFSEGIETIGDSAFYKCYKLKNVILPSTLKSIGETAFSDCEGLDEIVIPPEVTAISSLAFQRCKNMSRIVIYDKVKQMGTPGKFPYGGIDSSVLPMKEGRKMEIYGIPGSYIEEYANICSRYFVFKPISEYPGNLPNYANSATGNTEVCVKLNNEYLTFSQPPIIENGKTLVPLRAIFEALGAEVLWDGNTKTVTATKGETKISLQIGSTQMYVNGVAKTLKVPAKIVNSKTLVPARAVSEAFGCTVDWIGATKTVVITQTEK